MFAVKIWSILMTCIVGLKAECLWNEKTYPIGPIPSDDPCEICHCLDNDSYACSISNCPIPKDNCTAKMIPGHCCPGYNCGQDGFCRYKEKSIIAGEHFDLDVITMDCICLPNGDPNCTKCIISPEKLNSGCKPIYIANKMCPVDFICSDNGSNFKKSVLNLDFILTNKDNSSGNDNETIPSQIASAATSIILPLSTNKQNFTFNKQNSKEPILEADYKSNNGFKPDSWKPAVPKNDEWAMPIGAQIPIVKESVINQSDIYNETIIDPLDANETSWVGINASKPIRYPIIETDFEPDDTENILNINKPGQNNDSLKSVTPVPRSFRDWESNSDSTSFHLNLPPPIYIEPPLFPKEKNKLPKIPSQLSTINMEHKVISTISPELITNQTISPLNNFPIENVLHGVNDFKTQRPYSPNSGSQISTVLPPESLLRPPLVDFKINSLNRDNSNLNDGVKKESDNEKHKNVGVDGISEFLPDNQTDDIIDQLKLNVTSLNHNHTLNYSKVQTKIVNGSNMTHEKDEKESLLANVNVNSREGIMPFDSYNTTTSSIEVTSSIIPNMTFYQEKQPIINNITDHKNNESF